MLKIHVLADMKTRDKHKGTKAVAIPAEEYLHICNIPNETDPEEAFYILSGGILWEEALKQIELTAWGEILEHHHANPNLHSGDIVEICDDGKLSKFMLCATEGWVKAKLITAPGFQGHFFAVGKGLILL